jgi:hypothetical protein
MLQITASSTFWCGQALRAIREDCVLACARCFDGTVGYWMSQGLDEKAKKRALERLPNVEKQFRDLGLTITADTAKEIVEELSDSTRKTFQWLHDQAESLERLVYKELEGKFFLYISEERVRLWPQTSGPGPFGKKVTDKFPSAHYDIMCSALALGTSLATASVFHLMRVMEIGLGTLGKVFGVSLAHTNWEPALAQIESKIANMRIDPAWKSLPDYREQQEYYSQAASHFRTVKDAWRNYTMHARAQYKTEEAEQIFNAVKVFMQKLAERLSE